MGPPGDRRPGGDRHAALADPSLADRVGAEVVGRRRQLELVLAALAAGRHVLLEGPPGTGKSTLLAAVAAHGGLGFVAVEGSAELTPARLVGHHDPSRVLAEGYSPAIFVDGPLTTALRDGSLLYVEEINRVPEETLNVLVGVMSEGAITIPRLGRVDAADGFALVAAMNPFDAVGTARISAAIYDRTCRVLMDYQSAAEEIAIVERETGEDDDTWRRAVVEVVRRTRSHGDIRVGSSVRGAIDLVLVARQLAALRGGDRRDRAVALDAALAALSGRIRLHDGSGRSAEDVVAELFAGVFGSESEPEPRPDHDGTRGGRLGGSDADLGAHGPPAAGKGGAPAGTAPTGAPTSTAPTGAPTSTAPTGGWSGAAAKGA